MNTTTLPPPSFSPFDMPRSLRRHIEVSAPQVLVEMLDSALNELAIAEMEMERREYIKALEWTGPPPSWTSSHQDEQSDEYHKARLAVHEAEQRVAWCEKKVEIALEMAINPPMQFSGSVLLSASCIGNVKVVLALLKKGPRVNVNASSVLGMTALAYAVQGPMPGFEKLLDNYVHIVKALLKAGADVHMRDKDDRTILSRAISCGQKEIEALLRAHGAVD